MDFDLITTVFLGIGLSEFLVVLIFLVLIAISKPSAKRKNSSRLYSPLEKLEKEAEALASISKEVSSKRISKRN